MPENDPIPDLPVDTGSTTTTDAAGSGDDSTGTKGEGGDPDTQPLTPINLPTSHPEHASALEQLLEGLGADLHRAEGGLQHSAHAVIADIKRLLGL